MVTFLGCIADDFTGATDLASMLARSGVNVSLRIGVPKTEPKNTADIEVIALKTRSIPASDAVRESLSALKWLKQAGAKKFFLNQFTFIFGGYLVRAETLVAQDKELLGKIDINKQLGYLLGLGLSFLYYKTLEYGYELTDAKIQISILHYFLVGLQGIIILVLANSFSWK